MPTTQPHVTDPDDQFDAQPPADRPNPARLWRAAGLAAVTLAAGVLAACSSSGSSGSPATAAANPATSSTMSMSAGSSDSMSGSMSTSMSAGQSSAMIHISSFKYMVPASVSPGATVSVMNMDGEAHTVTADSDKAFSVTAVPGKVVTFKAPTKPGSYPFHCDFHSNMHGVLVVK